MKANRLSLTILTACLFATILTFAAPVPLQNATATFSQTSPGTFVVGAAINGTSTDSQGWAIDPQTGPQTAVFETAIYTGLAETNILTVKLIHGFSAWGQHIIGRFRLSVTTDDRSTFADGLPVGGDVTANWVILDPVTFTSSAGATLTKQPDLSILASGVLPETDTYTVTATTALTNITGIRLEALTDPSLPFNRPGRQSGNGNFVLSEFTVDIVPGNDPPTIQKHPQSQLGYWGGSVTFDVKAKGSQPLAYQWRRNGSPLGDASASSLVLTNLQLTDAGTFTVVITNAYGSITSNPAILTVNPAGVSFAVYPGVTITGFVGLTYGIQATTNLSDTNSWFGVANVTLDAPTRLWFDTQPATLARRFYRVVPGPISVP